MGTEVIVNRQLSGIARRAVLADCPPFGCIVVRRAGGRFLFEEIPC